MAKEKTRILAQLPSAGETRSRRLWGAAAVAGVTLLGMVAAFAVAPGSLELRAQQRTIIEPLTLSPTTTGDLIEPGFVREEGVQSGDTLSSLIDRLGINDDRAVTFLRESRTAARLLQQLRPGKTITATTDEEGHLLSMVFPLNGKDAALVVRRGPESFVAREQTLQLESRVLMKSGAIVSSLFGATDAAGLPDSVAVQLAEIFGGDIDFHRDLRRGDHFAVVFEMLYHQGRALRTGRILGAQFINQGKSYNAFYYGGAQGTGGYYDRNGRSIKKAFLRSPLEFSRISSGFTAARFHPILQTWRAHKGVDYAAPAGARVRATADGIVEFAGRQGGYGNLLVLRHQGKYTTHYGHLSRFGAGMRKGTRVSQGDIIGYVGATGWATGPHLHYEFRVDDVHQNPLTATLPSAPPLDTRQVAGFRPTVESLVARFELIKTSDALD